MELRRRNLIPEDAMPYKTGLQYTYDCGRFEANMDKALAAADYAGFEARRQEAAARGRLRGFGINNAIEQSAGLGDEGAEIRFDADGGVTLTVGTVSHGQGHETVFRQLLCDTLGVAFEQVRFVQGDTDIVRHGHGTFGSRSSGLGGGAIRLASERVIEKGKSIAAHHFETAAEDIAFDDGVFSVAGTDRSTRIAEVAAMAHNFFGVPGGLESGLAASANFRHPGPTFPNGTHCCEVEIDPETGVTELLNWVVVDDVGTVMNPMLLKGQFHGGIVQGAGQILLEGIAWDEAGQLVTGSFMDYACRGLTTCRSSRSSPARRSQRPIRSASRGRGSRLCRRLGLHNDCLAGRGAAGGCHRPADAGIAPRRLAGAPGGESGLRRRQGEKGKPFQPSPAPSASSSARRTFLAIFSTVERGKSSTRRTSRGTLNSARDRRQAAMIRSP